ncbi:MAG: ABC transporter permease subunit [Bdellovibrionales bacterium]|nr:ABC transporter permease subunit [Bdellovibrionales bacterium]
MIRPAPNRGFDGSANDFWKMIGLVFAALIGLTLLATVWSLSSREAGAAEPIRWAADTESGAPLVFQDPKNPGNIIGFEREVIEGAAKRLGRPATLVHNAWDGLIPGLARGNYDVIVNGLEITDERKKEIAFSDPYFITYEQLTVRKDESRIQSLEDCRGKKVGTLKFSLAQTILEKFGGIEIVTYEAEPTSYEDLKNGRTDAVLLDAPLAIYNAKPNPALKLVGAPVGRIEYGIGMKKSDTALLADLNRALGEMAKDGELRKIYERYALWNPLMAEKFGDKRPGTIDPPDMYEYFLNASHRERTWEDRAKLYVTFIPILAKGALTTLHISLFAMVLAVAFGLALALMRLYGPKPVSFAALLYIELIRGTPLLIQLFFIFYALPYAGLKLSPFVAAVLGLGLNYAAYEAENYRGGIAGVPKSQSEAGLALGLSHGQTIRHIVIPQALRIVIPPITNDFISLLKDSSLVSVITMVELTKLYGQLASTYYDFLGTGVLVAAFYLLLGLPFVRLARYVELRLTPGAVTETKPGFSKRILFRA